MYKIKINAYCSPDQKIDKYQPKIYKIKINAYYNPKLFGLWIAYTKLFIIVLIR